MCSSQRQIIAKSFCPIVLILTMLSPSSGFVEYADNTELIQQRSGYDVKLQCIGLNGPVGENGKQMPSDIQIHWYFKHCGEDTNNCHELYENSEWTPLPCEKSFCNSELLLRNVTEHYSGLYKCTFRSDTDHTVDIQFVRKFQLDVKNATNIAAPELLDEYPINQTAAISTQVVFQCRVRSELYPTIKWFRRLSLPNDIVSNEQVNAGNEKLVRYEGNVYELLIAAGEKSFNDDIYLSKLILSNVRLQDEGFYACVAISMRGFTIREAYLTVYTKEERDGIDYWSEYDDIEELSTNPHEFMLLFLMPIGLAILPLSVWLIWHLQRRHKHRNIRTVGGGLSMYSDDADRAVLHA